MLRAPLLQNRVNLLLNPLQHGFLFCWRKPIPLMKSVHSPSVDSTGHQGRSDATPLPLMRATDEVQCRSLWRTASGITSDPLRLSLPAESDSPAGMARSFRRRRFLAGTIGAAMMPALSAFAQEQQPQPAASSPRRSDSRNRISTPPPHQSHTSRGEALYRRLTQRIWMCVSAGQPSISSE